MLMGLALSDLFEVFMIQYWQNNSWSQPRARLHQHLHRVFQSRIVKVDSRDSSNGVPALVVLA
jgi:hypothetical protein